MLPAADDADFGGDLLETVQETQNDEEEQAMTGSQVCVCVCEREREPERERMSLGLQLHKCPTCCRVSALFSIAVPAS